MTRLLAFSKASARLRLGLLIVFFLTFWLAVAFLLHPEQAVQNPSTYLIPGGPRSNLLFMQITDLLKRFVALDTLARLGILVIGFLLARTLATHFLSRIYDLDNLNACHRFLTRSTFGLNLHLTLNRQNVKLLAAFPEINKIGGPVEITFTGKHPKFGIFENGGQISELSGDDLHCSLQPFQTLQLMQVESDSPFTMDCACRTLDGIRIGLTDIQVKYKALREGSFPIHHEKFVSGIVRSELNRYVRNQSMLQLLMNETPQSNPETWMGSPSMRSQIRALRPHISLLPTNPPVEYRAIFIPEVEYHDRVYSLDFCGKIVMNLNQRLKESQKTSGYMIEIIGMGAWKFLSDHAKKQMDKIWSYISSPVALDRPGQIEQKKQSCGQNIYAEHLSQLKQILSRSNSNQRSMTVILFYHEFLQRRIEDYRLEGLSIPAEILSLLEVLEDVIEPDLSNVEGGL